MKRLMLTLLLAGAACAGARAQQAPGQASEEKRRDIRRLLELNGAGQIGVQFFEMLLPKMKEVYRAMFDAMTPATRERALAIMEEEGRRGMTAERLVEELIPIYDRYFTGDEVKDLIAFYQSPAGRKFVAVQPLIMREGGAAGERIGNEMVERILKRYQEEGIVPGRAGQPPAPRAAPRRRTR